MVNKYNPDALKDEVIVKKMLIDTAVDVQSVLQLLIAKNIITKEELDDMRSKVKSIPKYKLSYEYIEGLAKASNLYENDPQAYLKALFEEKLKGQ